MEIIGIGMQIVDIIDVGRIDHHEGFRHAVDGMACFLFPERMYRTDQTDRILRITAAPLVEEPERGPFHQIDGQFPFDGCRQFLLIVHRNPGFRKGAAVRSFAGPGFVVCRIEHLLAVSMDGVNYAERAAASTQSPVGCRCQQIIDCIRFQQPLIFHVPVGRKHILPFRCDIAVHGSQFDLRQHDLAGFLKKKIDSIRNQFIAESPVIDDIRLFFRVVKQSARIRADQRIDLGIVISRPVPGGIIPALYRQFAQAFLPSADGWNIIPWFSVPSAPLTEGIQPEHTFCTPAPVMPFRSPAAAERIGDDSAAVFLRQMRQKRFQVIQRILSPQGTCRDPAQFIIGIMSRSIRTEVSGPPQRGIQVHETDEPGLRHLFEYILENPVRGIKIILPLSGPDRRIFGVGCAQCVQTIGNHHGKCIDPRIVKRFHRFNFRIEAAIGQILSFHFSIPHFMQMNSSHWLTSM